jgi:hypothetical protein
VPGDDRSGDDGDRRQRVVPALLDVAWAPRDENVGDQKNEAYTHQEHQLGVLIVDRSYRTALRAKRAQRPNADRPG